MNKDIANIVYSFQDFVNPELKEKISEYQDIEYNRKPNVNKIYAEDLITEIALDFWRGEKFDKIDFIRNKLKEISENDKNTVDIYELYCDLSNLKNKYNRSKREVTRRKIFAEGLFRAYEFTSGIEVLIEILEDFNISKSVEIEIRELIDFHVMDSKFDESFERENFLKLVLLKPNDHNILRFFFGFESSFFKEKEKEIAINILKNNDNEKYWELLWEYMWPKESFFDIYESVNPKCQLPIKVVKGIVEYYLYSDLPKAKGIMEKSKLCFEGNNIYEFLEARLLIKEGEYSKAEEILENLKHDNLNEYRIEFFIAICKLNLSRADEAIAILEKVYKKEPNNDVVCFLMKAYVMDGNEAKAVDLFKEWFNTYHERYGFINYIILLDEFESKFLIKCLSSIHSMKLDKNATSFDYIAKHIIYITEGRSHKGKDRYNLLLIYLYIRQIKNIQRVNLKNCKEVYHYSKLESLNSLPKYNDTIGGAKLRISNVAYLNDPAEGRTIFEMLRKGFYDTDIVSIIDMMIDEEKMKCRNNYLASFSLKKDCLPMWVQYAENGKGCHYSIDTSIFSNRDDSMEKFSFGRYYDSRSDLNINNEEYSLYKVYYYDQYSKETDEIKIRCNKIASLISDMKESLKHRRIREVIYRLVDEIRYLFKDKAYENEEEVRVVVTDYSNNKKIMINPEYRVPHFYIELDKELHFKEVMLGPKVRNVEEIATYLYCCENVDKITTSQIQYQ